MSLRKIVKRVGGAVGAIARVAAPVAALVPGIGTAAAAGLAIAGQIGQRRAVQSALPPVEFSGGTKMSMLGPLAIGAGSLALPSIGRGLAGLGRAILPGAGAAAGMAIRGAGAAMRGATAWCRRNPAWCANIGGTAAIAAMIERGELPMPRRRRGRGLSARDLRGFRRTARLIRQVAGSVGIRRGGRKSGGVGGGHTIVQN